MFKYNYKLGMKAGRWRSRTNLTFVATNLHHPLDPKRTWVLGQTQRDPDSEFGSILLKKKKKTCVTGGSSQRKFMKLGPFLKKYAYYHH